MATGVKVNFNFYVKKKDGSIERFYPEKILKTLKKLGKWHNLKENEIKPVYFDILHFLRKNFLPGETLTSLKLREVILKNLQEKGFTSLYRIFYSQAQWKNKEIKVIKRSKNDTDVTDYSLLVTSSREIVTSPWDRNKIINALIKETGIDKQEAKKIAKEVENKIISFRIKEVSTSLIRTLIDNILLSKGYNKLISRHQEVGISTYDLEKIVLSKPKENSNIATHNPEAVNLAIAEIVLKQYALNRVFSKELSMAHKEGVIHIHDLGYPVRVYCSAHSLEYLKKFGLKLDSLNIVSRPAKHARTLTGHLNTFLASMQAYYAGALGIGYVNIFYAPFLRGLSYREIKQEAQYLVFSLSQSAFSRGGQVLFVDNNLHTGIPNYLKKVPVIGPGGKYTGEKYGDYEKEARIFLKALLEVYGEGDGEGHLFAFPKCDLHLTEESFVDPEQKKLLELACEVASINGSPYFVFDRSEVTLSACCRLRTQITDNYMLEHPESMRFCGFQNVTINIPQAAYRAKRKGKGELSGLLEEIEKAMDMAVKAHFEKRKFIHEMMKPGRPLYAIGKTSLDGRPYVDLNSSTYIIGIIGLNEAVQFLTGKQLHESDEVYEMGIKVISFMYLKAKEYEKKYKLKFSLEESPAESATRRLAKVDLELYPESRDIIKGSISRDESYYTNSIHFSADAKLNFLDRIEKQSRFHPLIESGAIIHAFIGEKKPSAASIQNLIKKTWENTQCAQLTISPEFTICEDCSKEARGLKSHCPSCGSNHVYGITRIVGYYSRIDNWNKSKQGELKDRHKGEWMW